MNNKGNKSEHSRAKSLYQMFQRGRGTPNGTRSSYLSPDQFSLLWVNDMERLTKGEPTNLLKNGKLVVIDGHEYYYSNGKKAEQILSTKAYQVLCFYRYLCLNHPELVVLPKAHLILIVWDMVFEKARGAHCAHTCSNKTCVRHVRITTRTQNETDKHWHYFLAHPLFGDRFRTFVLNDPEIADIAKEYLI